MTVAFAIHLTCLDRSPDVPGLPAHDINSKQALQGAVPLGVCHTLLSCPNLPEVHAFNRAPILTSLDLHTRRCLCIVPQFAARMRAACNYQG
eukprot:1146419-Pelagomonas_calceolata.AAC.2